MSFFLFQIFVQKFLPGGKELIAGVSAQRDLEPLIMFGLGGIYVEVLKDVVFKIAPVTELEAKEMLSSIKAQIASVVVPMPKWLAAHFSGR